MLFLRQFRDPVHNKKAEVQELVMAETSVPLNQLSGGQLPGAYSIIFNDQASHPFSQELGTTSGVATPATLAVRANCGFTLPEATVL
jgi:hypothetical protein